MLQESPYSSDLDPSDSGLFKDYFGGSDFHHDK
jgi:hypothetical protein